MSAFLACDWGTTNLRAWVIDDQGRALRQKEFAQLGVSRLQPGEAARRFIEEVRPAMQAEDLPALLCGMIGSTIGWAVATYAAAPIGLDDLTTKLLKVEAPGAGVWIVPGVQAQGVAGAPEVMRGEETQALGWLAGDPARAKGRHLVCHPGTHAKWIVLEEGRLVRFVTAMTGELFDVLRKHSVLKTEGGDTDPDAFALGLATAGDGDALSSRLFTARTRVVAGGLDPRSAGSYLSGLLIGSEVAGAPRLLGVDDQAPIALVGAPALCALYRVALERRGHSVVVHDGDEASLAGLHALHRRLNQGAAG
jgi:2-dehydro-3-deoxygalactonokinase